MDDLNRIHQYYLSQIIDTLKYLYIRHNGMTAMLDELIGNYQWEEKLKAWCERPDQKADAERQFLPLAAVLQRVSQESTALKELSEALAQFPPGFQKKQN